MQFVSVRDFRTQTSQIWERLGNDEEIIITNNGRPRAFLVNIPDGFFEEVLEGIRYAKAKIKPKQPLHREYTSEEMKADWQELKNMLSGINGSDIDLKKLKADRRAAKYERNA